MASSAAASGTAAAPTKLDRNYFLNFQRAFEPWHAFDYSRCFLQANDVVTQSTERPDKTKNCRWAHGPPKLLLSWMQLGKPQMLRNNTSIAKAWQEGCGGDCEASVRNANPPSGDLLQRLGYILTVRWLRGNTDSEVQNSRFLATSAHSSGRIGNLSGIGS